MEIPPVMSFMFAALVFGFAAGKLFMGKLHTNALALKAQIAGAYIYIYIYIYMRQLFAPSTINLINTKNLKFISKKLYVKTIYFTKRNYFAL
jgi:hypothetical protein